MLFSGDQVDRYVRTFLDVWSLRPRRFMEGIDRNSSRYLGAYQFFFLSLSILFALYVAEISLTQVLSASITGGQGEPPSARAIATWGLTLFVVLFLVNSLVFLAISRLWPVRGTATFTSILKGQCYTVAIVLPFAAVVCLLSPFIVTLNIRESTIIFVGLAWGVVVTFGWQLPAVAFANGVSTGRIVGGLLFWPACLGAVIGAIGVVMIAAGVVARGG